MINQIFTVRGATTVSADTEEEIRAKSVALMDEIIRLNGLKDGRFEITDYIISTTEDITSFYPARAIRESGITAPVFSVREPAITGALKMCVRIAVRVANYGERTVPKHVYIGGAEVLRKDLTDFDR